MRRDDGGVEGTRFGFGVRGEVGCCVELGEEEFGV